MGLLQVLFVSFTWLTVLALRLVDFWSETVKEWTKAGKSCSIVSDHVKVWMLCRAREVVGIATMRCGMAQWTTDRTTRQNLLPALFFQVTKQRRELEKKSRLSADQVVQLAKVMVQLQVVFCCV